MVMEGPITDEDEERMIAETKARVAAWRPSAEATELLDTLSAQVGNRVEIRAWDPMMIWLDDEGPFPVRGRLVAVHAHLGKDGFPRPTMVLSEVSAVPTKMGYDGRDRLLSPQHREGTFAFEVARLFSLKRLREKR